MKHPLNQIMHTVFENNVTCLISVKINKISELYLSYQ